MPQDSRDESSGSPEEGWGTDGSFTAVRKWLCDWEDRYHILGLLSFCGGEKYPYGPSGEDGRTAFCSHSSARPFDKAIGIDDNNLAVYKKAEITAEYGYRKAGTVQPNPGNPTQMFSEMIEPTIEMFTLDPRSFEWQTPYWEPVPDCGIDEEGHYKEWRMSRVVTSEQAPGSQLYGEIYSYTRHNMVNVPIDILDYVGTVNKESVVTKTFELTYPPNTCLLLPSPIEVTWHSVGGWLVKQVSVSFRMHCRSIQSWNKFWRPDMTDGEYTYAGWDRLMCRTAEGLKPFEMYPSKSWTPLWD